MKRAISYLLTAVSTLVIGVGAFYIIRYVESQVLDWAYATPQLDQPAVASPDAALLEEQEIYRTVLREMYVPEGAQLLVIESQTEGCNFYEDVESASKIGINEDFHATVRGMLPTVETSTLDDYRGKNKTPGSLFLSDIGFDYVLVSPEAVHRFFGSEAGLGWSDFYQKYPKSGGLIYFSKIGFNTQRDQAMVYAGRSCGGLCGSGSYVLLKKSEDKWLIEKTVGLWVSKLSVAGQAADSIQIV